MVQALLFSSSLYLFVYPSFVTGISPSLHIYLYICLSIFSLSLCLSVFPSFLSLFVCLSFHLCVYLPLHLFSVFCLSVFPNFCYVSFHFCPPFSSILCLFVHMSLSFLCLFPSSLSVCSLSLYFLSHHIFSIFYLSVHNFTLSSCLSFPPSFLYLCACLSLHFSLHQLPPLILETTKSYKHFNSTSLHLYLL